MLPGPWVFGVYDYLPGNSLLCETIKCKTEDPKRLIPCLEMHSVTYSMQMSVSYAQNTRVKIAQNFILQAKKAFPFRASAIHGLNNMKARVF